MFGVLVGLKLLVEKTAAFAESYDQAGARLVQGLHAKSIMTLQGMLTSQDRPKKELLVLIDKVNFFGVCSRHSV